MIRFVTAEAIMVGVAWVSSAQLPSSRSIEGENLAQRLSLLDQVVPRSSFEIQSSARSGGTEAIDRDYSTYAAWRSYLAPLGMKRVRLQSGWTRPNFGESQAKWLRGQMLGDATREIPTSIFSLTEMHYPPSAEMGLTWQKARGDDITIATAKHFKGTLETCRYLPGAPQDDRTVVRTKMAYVAMQAVTAIFDSKLCPINANCQVSGSEAKVPVQDFRTDEGTSVPAAWRSGDCPGERPMHEAIEIWCIGIRFTGEPRYVDLLTRADYATNDVVNSSGDTIMITALPVYDLPVSTADAGLAEAQ